MKATVQRVMASEPQTTAAPEKLDFIGQVLCPLKASFKQGYDEVTAAYEKGTGKTFFSYVPTVCGSTCKHSEADMGKIMRCNRIEEFPDAVASCFFGDYFSTEFKRRFLDKGCFEPLTRPGINKDFVGIGIDDPKGEFNIYSGYPIVFLVDKKRLGNLPVPRTWEDILNPIYKDNITIGGSHGNVSATVPLYIYKEFGDKGLEMLEHNVKNAVHPSQMAKLAGSASSEGSAIYIIMLFFGMACGKTETTELVFPKDGAIIDPAFMLVKKGMTEKYKVLIDYVTGEKFGGVSSSNWFPVTSPDVNNRLPDGAKLKWLGWDFIHSHEMDKTAEYAESRFIKYI